MKQQIERAKERLANYQKQGDDDWTRETFEAMLDYGPPKGRKNVLDWILLPRIPNLEKILEGIDILRLQSDNEDICDDQTLYQRADVWYKYLIIACRDSECD